MGFQQILLIIVSVIIVVTAVFVGMNMLKMHSFDANKAAVLSDVQSYAKQVSQSYQVLISQGESRKSITTRKIAAMIKFDEATGKNSNQNGSYTVALVDTITATISATGTARKDGKILKVLGTVSLPDGGLSIKTTEEPGN